MNLMAKTATAVLLSASVLAGVTPTASANDTGAFLGGLAAGAIVGGAIGGGRPAPVYGPAYGPPVYYQRHCWIEARPVFNQFGYQVGTQQVQRCG
jgi:hypothetical protein